MPDRLADEEFARLAAAHSLRPDGQPTRYERIEPLKKYGVIDEATLAAHALEVMQAQDTKCFRGMDNRECYGNDRLNTIVRINENDPSQCTVHHNDNPDKAPSERVEACAKAERARDNIDYQVRTGGSKALEEDRLARPSEANQQPVEPNQSDQRAALQDRAEQEAKIRQTQEEAAALARSEKIRQEEAAALEQRFRKALEQAAERERQSRERER